MQCRLCGKVPDCSSSRRGRPVSCPRFFRKDCTHATFLAFIAVLGIFAIAAVAVRTTAQNGPPDGPGDGGPGGPPRHGHGRRGGPDGLGGFHLLPPFVVEKLDLTKEQQKKLAKLEKETKARLYKILTPDQRKTLEEARPPRSEQGGPAGGRRGPGAGEGGPGGPGGGRGGSGGGPGGGSGGPGGPGGPGGDQPPPRSTP